MKELHHCKSCGFLSTIRSAFTIFMGLMCCIDCKNEYGNDEDVTRWIDKKSLK